MLDLKRFFNCAILSDNLQLLLQYLQRCFPFSFYSRLQREDGVVCTALFQSPRTRVPGYNTGSLLALDDIKRSSTKPQRCNRPTSALNHGPGGPGGKIWAQNEMKRVKWTQELAQGLA